MSQYNFEEEARIQRQKINYFNSKVGNSDFDKAIDHLIIADWDEQKAVEMYLRLNKKKNAPQSKLPSINTKYNNNIQNPKSLAPLNNQKINNNNRTEINITDELLKNNIPYKNKDFAYFTDLFQYLQNKLILVEKSLDGFLKSLKEHPGIIILLNTKKIEELKKHIPKIINNFICPDINRITVMFPIMFDSFIGDKIIKQFACYNFPSYIFCQYESQRLIKVNGKMEGVFNINLFIDNVLKSLPEAKSNLKASLKTSLKKSIMFNYNEVDQEDDFNSFGKSKEKDKDIKLKDSIYGLSDGSILKKREQEIQELEREQLEKVKKEEEKKRKIKEEENLNKKRIEDYEKGAEMSKKLLPEEPEENNPEVSHIIFRYPDGEKTIERRFLKTNRINYLYLFVKSKGREIFFEQESNDFDLIYGFPPKNLDNSRYNTLEDEGLFPNAIIQIREIE